LSRRNPQDWLLLQRIVRFGDTDAAGVIHFHQLLRWCHESWEESLDLYGLRAVDIFPSMVDINPPLPIALPIVHCEADYFSPIRIADKLDITLIPLRLDVGVFQVKYSFKREKDLVAVALTRHRAINAQKRCSCNLPENIDRWLEASSLNRGVNPL